ncbi:MULTISPECIES: shikimate dehydrogenase [unclassified Microbacterium]|uniref:shikimate dehydrogenase family protein n=1 Tax=unclassified Microbacterium TaxID=2609290 RepID=UPI0012F8BBCD|nr:shikimate dehydrogenase [Microbacterium sp. MAH-37]MVQ42910.1 shikimate dehydrogenase [Microbacterium sp. MAH-37]
MPTRLAVWGDPIAHSRSPQLHAAAYRLLGLDWTYDRRRVDAAGFGDALHGLDDSWRGLSLTMPLKEQAFRAADELDRHAELTGAVNTLLLGDVLRGFNTDVGGLVDAFIEAGVTGIRSARILGAGATAASALVAASELGAERVEIRARRPEAAVHLVGLGERVGVQTSVNAFAEPATTVDLTIATLPSGTVLDDPVADALSASGGALLDAAYAPWPSALAARWSAPTVLSGLEMLLHQAVRQIRIFRNGSQDAVLPDEAALIEVMRLIAFERVGLV